MPPQAVSACGQPRLIDDMEVGDGGICFDASGFNGVKLFYKSSSPVRINFLTADEMPVVQGGKCNSNCNKWWGVSMPSTFDWTERTIRFAEATQKGSVGAAFHTNEIFNIEFNIAGTGQAFELWVDDISFSF